MAAGRKRKERNQKLVSNTADRSPSGTFQSSCNDQITYGISNNKSVRDCDDDDFWLPAWTPYVVWMLVAVIRVEYVCQPVNWWILHPDENFQSLEVAHTEVYGYGYRPYEFSSLSHGGAAGGVGRNISSYRQRELELGMHGMRSALYPTFYIVVSYLAAIFHLDIRPFVLWKGAHAIVSSLLLLAVYRFCKVYSRSHDAACLAAMLVATSTHLTVLGTHPLLSSFLSPAIFWAMSCLYPVLCATEPSLRNCRTFWNDDLKRGQNGETLFSALKTVTLTQNSFAHQQIHELPVNSHRRRTATSSRNAFASADTEAPLVVNTNSDLFNQTAKATQASSAHEALHTEKQSLFVHFLGAFVLALCVYVRVDVVLFVAVTLLPTLRPRNVECGTLAVCTAGSLFGVGFGVLNDFLFYDELVVSPGNWARFNFLRGFSEDFYGKSDFRRYFVMLFESNLGIFVLAICNALVFCSVVLSIAWCYFFSTKTAFVRDKNRNCYFHQQLRRRLSDNTGSADEKNNNNLSGSSSDASYRDLSLRNCSGDHVEVTTWSASSSSSAITLIFSWIVLLLIYSAKGHKELRFIHNVIALILTSSAIISLTALKAAAKTRKREGYFKVILFLCLALWTADQWKSFPSARDKSNESWAYQRIWDSHDINACLGYVGVQNDVTGIFVDSNFHVTGGYTLLGHDVPLFTLAEHEFVEFDASVRINLTKASLMASSKTISYVTMDRLSNFVSVQNSVYLVKVLIQKEHYNYLLVARERKFLAIGFKEVFTHGTMRVMKRTYDPTEERQLQAMAARAPIGVNATVLKYEGDVLFRFQRFELALERYEIAFQLEPAHSQLFQAMAACKVKLEHRSEANRLIETCVKQFGTAECNKPLAITNINPHRDLF